MDALSIGITIAVYVITGIVFCINCDFNSNYNSRWKIGRDSDKSKTYMHLLYWLGITPSYLNAYDDKAAEFKFSYFWVWIWPIIIPVAIIKLILNATLFKIERKIEEEREKNRVYIKREDIFSFQRGDKIIMKDGKVQILDKFSPMQFSDPSQNVYNWLDAKENQTYTQREKQNISSVNFALFEKQANSFENSVKEFQLELNKQRKDLIEKF